MFLKNKYTIWYYRIINRALSENRTKKGLIYYENHHIIPKCMGGNDEKENLVLLTGKEHYVCHHFLCKMTDNLKFKQALKASFAYFSNNHKRNLPTFYVNQCKKYNGSFLSIIPWNKGKKWSDDIRKKISDGRKGINTNTQESIEKKRISFIKNNPMHNLVSKEKHNEKREIMRQASCKKCTDGIRIFESLTEAQKFYPNIKYSTLAYYCSKEKNGWSKL